MAAGWVVQNLSDMKNELANHHVSEINTPMKPFNLNQLEPVWVNSVVQINRRVDKR